MLQQLLRYNVGNSEMEKFRRAPLRSPANFMGAE